MRRFGTPFLVLSILLLLTSAITASDIEGQTQVNYDTDADEIEILQPVSGSADRGAYDCILKVYIAEPDGRWSIYDHAFLAFAVDSPLALGYEETTQITTNFSLPGHGYPDAVDTNIEAYAVVFNYMQSYSGDSDPYSGGGIFKAYYTDACAHATPGVPGYDTAWGTYTHTVFVEEASTTT